MRRKALCVSSDVPMSVGVGTRLGVLRHSCDAFCPKRQAARRSFPSSSENFLKECSWGSNIITTGHEHLSEYCRNRQYHHGFHKWVGLGRIAGVIRFEWLHRRLTSLE